MLMQATIATLAVVAPVCLVAGPLDIAAPTLPSSNLSAVAGSSAISIHWDAGDGARRIVVVSAGPVGFGPVDGVDYPATNDFSQAIDLGMGTKVIYNGTGTNVAMVSFPVPSLFTFRVYEYNEGDGQILYLSYPFAEVTVSADLAPVIDLWEDDGQPVVTDTNVEWRFRVQNNSHTQPPEGPYNESVEQVRLYDLYSHATPQANSFPAHWSLSATAGSGSGLWDVTLTCDDAAGAIAAGDSRAFRVRTFIPSTNASVQIGPRYGQGALPTYGWQPPAPGDDFQGPAGVTLPPVFSITATAGVNGSISPSGVVSVVPGGATNFLIQADAGYHISDIRTNGASIGGPFGMTATNYAWSGISGNWTLSAAFEADPPLVDISEDDGAPTPSGTDRTWSFTVRNHSDTMPSGGPLNEDCSAVRFGDLYSAGAPAVVALPPGWGASTSAGSAADLYDVTVTNISGASIAPGGEAAFGIVTRVPSAIDQVAVGTRYGQGWLAASGWQPSAPGDAFVGPAGVTIMKRVTVLTPYGTATPGTTNVPLGAVHTQRVAPAATGLAPGARAVLKGVSVQGNSYTSP